jgi:hypothetical protein
MVGVGQTISGDGFMAEQSLDESSVCKLNVYNIYSQSGFFTVNFRSPYNSMHQISGFKTEDEAHAWIAETKLLMGMYA